MTEQRISPVTTIAGGPDHAVTVRHVRAEGSDREIGRTLAAAAEAANGGWAAPTPADPFVEDLRRRWFRERWPAQAERITGVAEHFGLDPAAPSHTCDVLGTYELPAGCSVAHYPGVGTKDGHGVLARNFDFPTATLSQMMGLPASSPTERPLGADPWVVELHPERGYSSVAVGIMDVMGAMDGVNEAGLAVALLADDETPEREPVTAFQVGLAEQQVVRHLLDTCATVDEAKAALMLAKHYYFFTPCHYVVADRTGASFVWEHSGRRNRELVVAADPAVGNRVSCTNHLLHRWPDADRLPDDAGPDGMASLSYDRWRSLDAFARSGGILGRDDIASTFEALRFTAPLVEARTFWHATYDTEESVMEVSFFTHDEAERSVYSDPLRVAVGPRGAGGPTTSAVPRWRHDEAVGTAAVGGDGPGGGDPRRLGAGGMLGRR
jgi:hypothetical protein